MGEINSIEISAAPFDTMRIDPLVGGGTPKVELGDVRYFRLFLHGLACVEVAATDFRIETVDVDAVWSGRQN